MDPIKKGLLRSESARVASLLKDAHAAGCDCERCMHAKRDTESRKPIVVHLIRIAANSSEAVQ